jgi:hypothetical protein
MSISKFIHIIVLRRSTRTEYSADIEAVPAEYLRVEALTYYCKNEECTYLLNGDTKILNSPPDHRVK